MLGGKDVLQLDDDETRKARRRAIRTLVEAALQPPRTEAIASCT